MSLVAYHNGKLGSDTVAIEDVTTVRTITHMQKLFTSETNDFHYGYAGNNVLKRNHPALQASLRAIISDVIKNRSHKGSLIKLKASLHRMPSFIVVTKDRVFDIKEYSDDDLMVTEFEFDAIASCGTNDLFWRLAYKLSGNFKKSVRVASEYGNATEGECQFLNAKTLMEFIPCE